MMRAGLPILAFAILSSTPIFAQNAVPVNPVSGSLSRSISQQTNIPTVQTPPQPQIGYTLPPSAVQQDMNAIAEVYVDENGVQQRCYGTGCAERLTARLKQLRAVEQQQDKSEMLKMLQEEKRFKRPGASIDDLDKDLPDTAEQIMPTPKPNNTGANMVRSVVPEGTGKSVNIKQMPSGAVRTPETVSP